MPATKRHTRFFKWRSWLPSSPRLASWRPWLELFRLPNLLSAPGDALAGLALAQTFRHQSSPAADSILLAVCVTLLYAYGLVDNDLCDLQEDSRLRPERPLPSHRLTTTQARVASFCCLIPALLLALLLPQPALLTILLLALLIHSYNSQLKKNRLPGSLAMGLCRGLSLLAGAACISWKGSLLPVLLGTTLFIAAVTWLAEDENRTTAPSRNIWLPALSLLAGGVLQLLMWLPVFRWNRGIFLILGLVALLYAIVSASLTSRRLMQNQQISPQEMRRAIGAFLGCLLPWQASWLLLGGRPWAHAWGILLLLAIPLSRFLRQRIAAS